MKKALLIGINYKNTHNELTGCINDALALKKVLEEKCGYNNNNITVITDDEKIKPTKSNILKMLKEIIYASSKCNEIWIHYSGHGHYIHNSNIHDEYDEVLVPLDYYNGFILDNELKEIITKSQSTNTYITFDCCHSGSALDLCYGLSIQKNKLISSYDVSQIGKKTSTKNIFMISGCLKNQKSIENTKNFVQMGAMTSSLLKILEENNYDITIGNLIIQMNKKLVNDGHTQIPVFSSNKSILLSRNFLETKIIQEDEKLDELGEKIKKIVRKELYKLLKSKNNTQSEENDE